MKSHTRFSFSTSHIIMLSFLAAILIGSILLSLPISSADGKSIAYIDALFTATTATCVTGLVTVPTVSTFSVFGQVVILLLIQIGGLGVITVLSGIMIALNKRVSLSQRVLLQDAFNLNNLSGLIKFVKKVIFGTFIIEGLGALLYMPVFIKDFGLKGIWVSVFTSISAFCNAGIDIIGETSLCSYTSNVLVNTVTVLLIILGGIGFIVWWDIIRVFKNIKKLGLKALKGLTLHTKLVLTATAVLIFAGAALIFIYEYNNPLTIKEMSLFEKVQFSLFQSVTTRTAGFATLPQENLSDGASIVSMLLMFIGGSPVGTAGGVKTITLLIIFISAFSMIRNQNSANAFRRTISEQSVKKAIAVVSMSFIIMITSTLLLLMVCDAPAIDIFYETVSATATVGLTRNLTSTLNLMGKIIIIITMYLGRIGPISLAIAFNIRKQNKNIIKNPTADISVG